MGTRGKIPLYKSFIACADLIFVNLGFVVAYWLRFGSMLLQENLDPYLKIIPWISITAFIIFYMFDLYTYWRRKSIHNQIYTIVLSVLTLTLFTVVLTFWDRGFAFPRSVILMASVFQILLISISRSIIWFGAKQFFGRKRVLIVEEDRQRGLLLGEKFLKHTNGWFVVQAYLSLSEQQNLESKMHNVDVVLLRSNLSGKAEMISCCMKAGKEVLIVPQLFELFVLDSEPQQIDDMLVLSILPPELSSSQLLIKRAFDIVTSIIILILLSPIMLFLYFLIPLTSPGPAFYKQVRLGMNSNPYQIYKYRSMVQDAEKGTGPVLATDKDPRITAIGRFIRATRLDELPQLINVLKGDMSLVGPRPERKFFIDQFINTIPDYVYRMSVKPGVTGLAQVMAKYNTTVEDKLRYDLMYVRKYSFALDVKILIQTIRVVFQREQAVGVQSIEPLRKEEIGQIV